MKKIYFSTVLVALLSIGLQAQNVTKGVAFTTGGSFMAPNNHVKYYAFETLGYTSVLLDSIPGDFSNQVLVDGVFAYVHVGRAGGHPAGADRIYKYNLAQLDGAPIDSTTEISGIYTFEIHNNLLIISRGYPATQNFIEVVDKNNLQNSLFTDNTITGSCAGIAVMNNKAYVAATDYMNNAGVVHIIDLQSTVSNAGAISLDSLSIGATDIFAENDHVFMTSKRYRPDYSTWYNGITTLDVTDSTFITDTAGVTAAAGFDFYNSMILGNFGNPLETYDVNTKAVSPVFSAYGTDAKKDPNTNRYAVQTTDYFSVGAVTIYDATGTVLGTTSTDISGSALAMATNNLPTAVNDTVVNPVFNGGYTMIDAMANDFDIDQEPFYITEIVTPPMYGVATVGAVQISYELTAAGILDDSFTYMIRDSWGDSAIATVYLNWPTSVEENSSNFTTKLFPNPANNSVHISSNSNAVSKVKVFDVTGRVVKEITPTSANIIFDVSNYKKGVYLVKITSNGKTETHRLLVN